MNVKDKYVTEVPIAIVAEGSMDNPVVAVVEETTEEEEKPDETATVSEAVVEESKEESAEAAAIVEEEKGDATEEAPKATAEEETATEEAPNATATAEKEETITETPEVTAEAVVIQPTCVVTLRVTYKPSPKDQREELYELLNKTSQCKARALEKLRKMSMQMTTTSRGAPDSSPSNTTMVKPSMKPGFLNKKKKEPTRMQKLYERTVGPNSLLRRGLGLAFFGKDYLIFFGAITFFHFKGQMLALPPPV
jgi:hypothetical protein